MQTPKFNIRELKYILDYDLSEFCKNDIDKIPIFTENFQQIYWEWIKSYCENTETK